uniref:Mitochondrial ribosomal protein L27 n=1 Tax=Gasterosteus aculeatus aculeatus TaxID=481459 RepID=A0AAQ4RQB2_GASAC
MAALASLMLKSRAGLLGPGQAALLDSVRSASKKAGGSSKNLGGKSPGRRHGFKKQDGNFVHAGNILATQRLMRFHPGAHVSKPLLCHVERGAGAVKMSTLSSLLVSRRWAWEPTRRSLLWRTATSGSPRRSTSRPPAASSPPRSSPSCLKEPCSTRPSLTSCRSNRRGGLNWWTWSERDGRCFPPGTFDQ